MLIRLRLHCGVVTSPYTCMDYKHICMIGRGRTVYAQSHSFCIFLRRVEELNDMKKDEL